jgi:hypothetical protein
MGTGLLDIMKSLQRYYNNTRQRNRYKKRKKVNVNEKKELRKKTIKYFGNFRPVRPLFYVHAGKVMGFRNRRVI